MHRPGNRSGKWLLVVGLGLCALVLLDTRKEVVEAHGLNSLDVLLPPVEQPLGSSVPTDAAIAPQSPQTAPGQTPTPDRQTLAVNTEIVSGDRDPSATTVDPETVAVNTWRGASFPVENFQAYTSPFGYRQSPTGGYTQEFHYGLDLAAPDGSYIRNWWGGTVVEVSDDSNCGTSVVVESGDWLHIYCHMRGHVESDDTGRYMIDREGGVQIWEGQELRAGERIGRVGMTGRTTGPHLHWGLKFEGNWVDPALVLRAMYAEQRNAANPGVVPRQ